MLFYGLFCPKACILQLQSRQVTIKYLHKNEVELSEAQNLSAEEKDRSEKISLVNALKKLSGEERDIMILYYSSGYNSKEIGEILGLKDSTVRSKIKRATEKLREMLVE